jgi:hypothetical protein
MKSWIIAMVAGLWLGGSAAMADAQAAFKVASKALATAETEQQVEDAFAKGALGIVGDPKVRQYRDLLESARDAAWKRVALPEGIRVTHVGVKPGKTADGTILPVRTFGFEVTVSTQSRKSGVLLSGWIPRGTSSSVGTMSASSRPIQTPTPSRRANLSSGNAIFFPHPKPTSPPPERRRSSSSPRSCMCRNNGDSHNFPGRSDSDRKGVGILSASLIMSAND